MLSQSVGAHRLQPNPSFLGSEHFVKDRETQAASRNEQSEVWNLAHAPLRKAPKTRALGFTALLPVSGVGAEVQVF